MDDIGCFDEIPETGETLEENAKIKADYVVKNYSLSCFSDDTGLLIDVLGGAPGVYSARYTGPRKNAADNMAKVLEELEGIRNRSAHFKTVIHLNLEGQAYAFEGIVEGSITEKATGEGGFGYDPIFQPEGLSKTFGELPPDVKNEISHRGRAIQKLVAFLEKRM